MNLTEKMALDCGVKVSTPYLDKYFFPLKNDNFIIFDTRCKNPFGEYDYFNDVFDLIKEELKRQNIEVFQIADEKNNRLPCDRCFISLNKKQENYLISKAKLLISNENYTLHVASIFNTKSIGLYSLNYAANIRPIWNLDSQIILESDRDGNLPSYGTLNESPKTVNFISPYVVASKILNSLNLKHDLDKYDLVYLGKSFHQKVVEVVPNFISSPEFMKNKSLNLRLDYVQNLNVSVLNYWLTNKKVNIITDKDINTNLLIPHKNNIIMMTIMISPNISETFLQNCKSLGLKIKIFCDSKEKINDYRFKFLNWEIDKDFDEENNLEKIKNLSEKSKFISSKILISSGKQYSCKANYLVNKHLDNREEYVTLSKDFQQEIEFFKIYNERQEQPRFSSSVKKFSGLD